MLLFRPSFRNLEDAGCDPETVEEFLALDGEGKTGEQLKLLARQRRQLLDRGHREEKRIDCLDYLAHQLNKMQAGVVSRK